MADRPTFLVQFPEFLGAPFAMLDSFLAAATLEIDATLWGARTDQGIYYTMAHNLAISPFGNSAKLSARDGVSTYGTHLDKMKRAVTAGKGRVC